MTLLLIADNEKSTFLKEKTRSALGHNSVFVRRILDVCHDEFVGDHAQVDIGSNAGESVKAPTETQGNDQRDSCARWWFFKSWQGDAEQI